MPFTLICNVIQETLITVIESGHAAACQSKLSGKLASQTNTHIKQTMSINKYEVKNIISAYASTPYIKFQIYAQKMQILADGEKTTDYSKTSTQ